MSRLLLLDGDWELVPLDAAGEPAGPWLSQALPAHWQEHPALREHVGAVRYRKRFAWPPAAAAPLAPGDRVLLRLNGVFYRFAARLNGEPVGAGEGYFFPHDLPVTGALVPGENELTLDVDSPAEASILEKTMITGVFAHWDAMSAHAHNAGGLWRPVELVRQRAQAVKRLAIATEAFDEGACHLTARLDLRLAEPLAEAPYRLAFTPENFEGEPVVIEGRLSLAAGEYGASFPASLAPYRLWWTHDRGYPHLYRVRLELEGCEPVEIVTGLRTWAMHDFVGHLNGQRIYLKGSNCPPADVRLARYDAERAALDLRLAKDAHMNLLRVHAHVGHPALYEAADRAGVLLWQDFPLQWLYHRSILPEALHQSQEMVRLLGHHPSIVIWCLHNEPLHVDDTSVEPLLRKLRTYWSLLFNWNRDVMGKQLAAGARHLDPSRTVIRASGELWIPFWMDGTDGHYYFGWYMSYGPKRLFDLWCRAFPRNLRFVTEFGAQSFPNLEASRRFLPESLEGADFRALHRAFLLQWDLMTLWVDPGAKTLPELVERTQAYQAELQRYYVDRLRLRKYRPNGGFLNFMFTDAHPAVSWSMVDYWREPKLSYHAYAQALSPVYAFALTPKDRYRPKQRAVIPVHVVNDRPHPVAVKVTVSLHDPAGGARGTWTHALQLGPDAPAMPVSRVSFLPDAEGPWALEVAWEAEGEPAQAQRYPLPVRA